MLGWTNDVPVAWADAMIVHLLHGVVVCLVVGAILCDALCFGLHDREYDVRGVSFHHSQE